jgi:hypothetical protein
MLGASPVNVVLQLQLQLQVVHADGDARARDRYLKLLTRDAHCDFLSWRSLFRTLPETCNWNRTAQNPTGLSANGPRACVQHASMLHLTTSHTNVAQNKLCCAQGTGMYT